MTVEQNRQLIIDRIVAEASWHLEVRAALIYGAPDPIQMVEWLKPVITNPAFDGGAIPSIYREIAAFALELRRAKSSPTITAAPH